jgi:hypothetical protein
MTCLFINFWAPFLTILVFGSLAVLAGAIYVQTIPTNSNFDLLDVCSLDTTTCTKVLSAWIFPWVVFIFPVMSCLMNPFFLFATLHSTAGAYYHYDVLLSLATVPGDDDFTNPANVHALPLLPANDFCS